MTPLEEDWVRAVWLKLASEGPEATLAAMQELQRDQAALFRYLAEAASAFSESATEVIFDLGVMVYQVFAWRSYPRGPLRVALVEEERLRRQAERRGGTVGVFLGGKAARGLPLVEALEQVAAREAFSQMALLGHVAEGLLAAEEEGELTREEVEGGFVALLVIVDVLDQVVKS